MNLSSYLTFNLEWDLMYEVWRLVIRMPAVNVDVPLVATFHDDDFPKDVEFASELFASSGYIVVVRPEDVYEMYGVPAFIHELKKAKGRIIPAIPNDELIEAVKAYLTKQKLINSKFEFHCIHKHTPANQVPNFIDKIDNAEKLRFILHGLNEYVKHPITNRFDKTVQSVIIDLNDGYKWSRERIADWLDTLDIDLTFKVEENV